MSVKPGDFLPRTHASRDPQELITQLRYAAFPNAQDERHIAIDWTGENGLFFRAAEVIATLSSAHSTEQKS